MVDFVVGFRLHASRHRTQLFVRVVNPSAIQDAQQMGGPAQAEAERQRRHLGAVMTDPTPDGVPCRHCGKPILWDEITWVHQNGFADCELVIGEGIAIIGGAHTQLIVDPGMHQDPDYKDKRALPIGEWS